MIINVLSILFVFYVANMFLGDILYFKRVVAESKSLTRVVGPSYYSNPVVERYHGTK